MSLGFSFLLYIFVCHSFFSFSYLFAATELALSFSLKFLSISMHTSGSIGPITLIWVSLERSFPPAELSTDDANFGQRR